MSKEQLPKDWKWVNLGEVAKIKGGKRLPKGELYAEEKTQFPYLRVVDFENMTINQTDLKYLNEQTQKQIKNYTISSDDLYISIAGTIGRVGMIPQSLSGANLTENAAKITEVKEFDLKYLSLVLNSLEIQQQIAEKTIATTQPKLALYRIEKLNLALPPKTTQQAIVSKIEELFSELDKGIENLRTAQQQLKTYRQSVLKWAFEGKLTNENVKEGELPKEWKILKLKEIASDISDGDHQAPPKSNVGIPFITISNVNKDNNKIDFSDTFSVNEEYFAKLKINRKPVKGDVLYTVTGSFGIPILIDFEKEFCFQRHIGLVRPLQTTNQKWLYYLLQSPEVFNQAKSTATGTAQKTVALNSLRNFEIPFCKNEEQNKIVQEIESRLSVADKMEESINQSLQQAEALRQSILKKAFEGKLI